MALGRILTSNFLAHPEQEDTTAVAGRVPFLKLKIFLCSILSGYILDDLGLLLKILSWDFYFYLNMHVQNSTTRTIA